MKQNHFQDWIQALLKNSLRIESQLKETKKVVIDINKIFSQQLCNLPINEEKYDRMVKNGQYI